MKNDVLYYSVGALLYCPANKKSIADSIINESFGTKFSLALCLEDTINDKFVAEAEQDLVESINRIYISSQEKSFYLPKIFIRVRVPEQVVRLTRALGESISVITGFIIPKFCLETSGTYINEIIRANEIANKKLYMMPIYESSTIINLNTRYELLYELKDSLAKVEDLVLNIRVGGNDLCHVFGFRRHSDESIHRIRPIANIFSDMITVYGTDYVVSGPVWEYYSGDNWEKGLIAEIKDDQLCGFTGKTVIHPKQIEVVNKTYRVSRADYNDAQSILGWNKDSNSLVCGSESKERMNEYKTHVNWAHKTMYLAEAFGIEE